MTAGAVRIGVTLPSLAGDPELALAAARVADTGGLDGTFVFDHLFRGAAASRRPADEMSAMLGALAVETRRVAFGPLVARVTVRPPAVLASLLETAGRLAPGRLVATLGAGDDESEGEQRAFGLDVGTPETRVAALERAVEAASGRGFPVWVGGRSARVRALAARMAEGWNAWNVPVETFAAQVAEVRAARATAGLDPASFVCSWGGLVLVGEGAEGRDDVIRGPLEHVADELARVARAGASWIVVALVDAAQIEGHHLLAEELAPAVRARGGAVRDP